MPALPTTLIGVVVLIALVLPGVIYSATRARFCGFRSTDRELGAHVVRAITFSFIIDSIYLVAFGDRLLNWFEMTSGKPAHPRELGIALFTLGALLPAVIATILFGKIRRKTRIIWRWTFRYPWPTSPHEPTPTAWDKAAPNLSDCWVRVRLSDDRWIGGWVSSRSYVSTYPEPPDIYLESQHHMTEDGEIGSEIENTAGVWVPLKEASVVEWIHP
ncbi:DUF6338 family protein [Nocardia sp. CC201C]|uniref:DUF6338 family protein n=1 Tax=Nocardia sp. CC201C TaxID=3044575 RepID=UPI0024A86214|nr:DUF6338 family protein [Nocardia sp. CC201C]